MQEETRHSNHIKRRRYLTSDVSGSLGVFDGNGISSYVIAFCLGLIPGLLIMFLQRKLNTYVNSSQDSLIARTFLITTSLVPNCLGAPGHPMLIILGTSKKASVGREPYLSYYL